MLLRRATRAINPNSATPFTFGGFARPDAPHTDQTGPNAVSVKLETVKVVDSDSRPGASRDSTQLMTEKDEEKMV